MAQAAARAAGSGRPGMPPGRPRLGARLAAAALGASLAVSGLAVASPATALAAPAAPVPPAAPPAAQVQVNGAPVPVPPIPAVPAPITNGQDPATLLARAIALSGVGTTNAPLQAQLAAAQQTLDAQSVTAAHAAAAAAAATRAANDAADRAAKASAAAKSLQGALQEAALRIYTGGAVAAVPSGAVTHGALDADMVTDAAVYEDTVLSPDGILAQRKAAAAAARTAAAEQRREQAAAVDDANLARAALAQAGTATDRIKAQLAGLDASTATLVAAEHQAVSAQAAKSLVSGGSLQFTPAAPLPAPLPTTAVALAWAFSELGKPYVWGATGPDVFDCSGLTQYSWAHAGVGIPRVAADQDAWTVPVPLSQLLPGDLVFYGTTDIHHVGMYIGDGLMINAPHTGDVVRISPIWWSDLAGFGRVHAAGVPVPSRVLPAAGHPVAPAVVPAAGAVPSQSAPPPGYTPPPGATSPMPTTTAPPTGNQSPAGGTPGTTTTAAPPAPAPGPTTTTTTPGLTLGPGGLSTTGG